MLKNKNETGFKIKYSLPTTYGSQYKPPTAFCLNDYGFHLFKLTLKSLFLI